MKYNIGPSLRSIIARPDKLRSLRQTLFTVPILAILALASSSVNADEKSRLDRLEKKLEASQKEIRKLTQKTETLERKLKAKKNNDGSSSSSASDASNNDSEERLETLEDSLLDLEERVGSRAVVNAFDSTKLDIGGFFHSAYTAIDGENGNASSFNRQNFELLISAELNETWSGFFAGGFLRESDDAFALGGDGSPAFNSRNKNPLIIGWVNYSSSDAFNIRIGRFITPQGIINIEHFPATLLDPEQPQFLRPFSGDTIFPNFSTGVQLHGSTFLGGDRKLQYYLYASSFAANPEENLLGGMLEYEFFENLTFGVNLATGKRANGADYDMSGLHLLYDNGRFAWKNEWYETKEDSVLSGDRRGGYTQPSWSITPEWIVFVRVDRLDNGFKETDENAFGINYLPFSNVRLRAVYTQKTVKRYASPFGGGLIPKVDADIFQLSGTFSF